MKANQKIDPTFHEHVVKMYPLETQANYQVYRYRWTSAPKEKISGEFPIHVDFELTSACNLSCGMCPFAIERREGKLKIGYMDFELFRKGIDEGVKKGMCSIKLQYRGESMLHPDIAKFVKYAKERNVTEVMFDTNAQLRPDVFEERMDAMIQSGLDKLIISIDAYDKSVYEAIRKGASWERLITNLNTIKRLKAKYNTWRPYVRVQMVDLPKAEYQKLGFNIEPSVFKEAYIAFWTESGLVDSIATLDYSPPEQSLAGKKPVVDNEFSCAYLYQRLIVLWDGQVVPCCRGNNYPVGDLNQKTLSEIWNNIFMNSYRKLTNEGKSHLIEMCANCGYRDGQIQRKNQ